jgi:hypothetical protein
MRFLMRQTVYAVLLAMVAFTSVQLAAARGQSPAVGTMVICTGTGPVHILVDENGQPTGGLMVCPDYALAFFAHLDVTAPDVTRIDVWHTVWRGHTTVLVAEQSTPLSQPRGPPVFS